MLSRSIYLVLFFINYSCSNLPEGFVYINDLDNRINIDLRYSTENNFTGKVIDGYRSNKAIISTEAAMALIQVQNDLDQMNFSLKIFDAYRPQISVNYFIKWSNDPSHTINKSNY